MDSFRIVHDLPSHGWRIRELAEGIYCTVVSSHALLGGGKHVGTYPGRVPRRACYQGMHNGQS